MFRNLFSYRAKIELRNLKTFFAIRRFLVVEFTPSPYRRRLIASFGGIVLAIAGFSAPLGFATVGEMTASLSTVVGAVIAFWSGFGAVKTIEEAKPKSPDFDFAFTKSPAAPFFIFNGNEKSSVLPPMILGDWAFRSVRRGASDSYGSIYVSRSYESRVREARSIPFKLIEGRTERILKSYAARWQDGVAALFCMTQKRPLTNEKKVSQWLFPSQSDTPLQVAETSYMASAITNELAHKAIYERSGRGAAPQSSWELRFDFFKNISPFVSCHGIFQFDESKYDFLSNHIGVTTLAITRDGYALIFRVQSANQTGAGEMSCAGSGSMDMADLKVGSGETNFGAALRFAMARELLEETKGVVEWSSFNQNVVRVAECTILIGCFLWPERGCKPEYLGVTRLDVDYSKIAPDSFELGHSTGLRFHFRNHDFCDARQFFDKLTEQDVFSLSTAALIDLLIMLGDAAKNPSNPDYAFANALSVKIFAGAS